MSISVDHGNGSDVHCVAVPPFSVRAARRVAPTDAPTEAMETPDSLGTGPQPLNPPRSGEPQEPNPPAGSTGGGSAGRSAVTALPITGAGQQASETAIAVLMGAMSSLVGLIATTAIVRACEQRRRSAQSSERYVAHQ